MSLAILFHFLCAQHVSDINISIIRSLRLCCRITTSVVLFSVRCVLEIWCGWCWVVPVLQAEACKTNTTQNQAHQISNTQRTENKTTDVVIRQHSRKLLMMDILISETCWVYKKWNKIASDIKLAFHSSTITMMHGPITIRVTSVCVIMHESRRVVIAPYARKIETYMPHVVFFCWPPLLPLNCGTVDSVGLTKL